MSINRLKTDKVDETPPLLNLTREEIEALAHGLVDYHTQSAHLYYRTQEAPWRYKNLQGVMSTIERQAIQPMAMTLEDGKIQAMRQFVGQGRWRDERLLQKHRQLVDETLGEDDGV